MQGVRFRRVAPGVWLVAFALLGQLFVGCGGEVSGPSRAEVDDGICARASQLGCVGQSQCEASLRELRDDAAKAGCSGEMDSALSCFAQRFDDCESGVEGFCPAEADAVDRCYDDDPPPGADCFVSSSGQDCALSCADYSAECYVLANATIECRCVSGPKAGQFLEADCDSIADVAAACR